MTKSYFTVFGYKKICWQMEDKSTYPLIKKNDINIYMHTCILMREEWRITFLMTYKFRKYLRLKSVSVACKISEVVHNTNKANYYISYAIFRAAKWAINPIYNHIHMTMCLVSILNTLVIFTGWIWCWCDEFVFNDWFDNLKRWRASFEHD